jgi:hypothetical protein
VKRLFEYVGRALIILCGVATLWAADDAAARLVGTWKLVRFVDTPEGGEPIYEHDLHPVGQFIYTADGHVSVQIMHDPSDPKPAPSVPGLEPSLRYVAYFGTYTVMPAEGVVIHHVIGGNRQSYINTDQRRPFQLQGDTLNIGSVRTVNGVKWRSERILVRESGVGHSAH